jgi:predicted Zn-dependent protease
MVSPKVAKRLIEILHRDAKRALSMKVRGFPRPYYCSFLLRDIKWFNTWASSGSLYRRKSDHTRNVYCDIRVGSYKYDQTTSGGLNDNDEDRESNQNVRVPTDDRVYDGLRLALWRITELRFRDALSDYSAKEAQRISKVNPNGRLQSFRKFRATTALKFRRVDRVDEEQWVKFCKQASRYLSKLSQVSQSWVEFDVMNETKIFCSTERRTILQQSQVFQLTAVLRKLTPEGSHIDQELVVNVASIDELPTLAEFKKLILETHARLLKLAEAKQIHAFSGPVLLYPIPAGLLFHEAMGHRLEGSRLIASGEGQTFRGHLGERVLNVDITVRDDPTMKRFGETRLIGAYEFDDEGAPAKNTVLIERGVLKGFLTTRAELPYDGYEPNGHARNRKFQRPVSRMANLVVEGAQRYSIQELRARLIQEIRKQKKRFGMIVYESAGGETETTNYDFQAFCGEVAFATLLYPDGTEIPIRGVNFVGTPLQALNNIVAVGDQSAVDNSFCGAESGFIPVTTISPALLLSNLELQAKEEELVTQFILPRPKL